MTDYNIICTTIEQSKRLVEAGIDPASADCYYSVRRHVLREGKWVPELFDLYVGKPSGENAVPAWSLGLLIEISRPVWAILEAAGFSHYGPKDAIDWLVNLIVGNMSLVKKKYKNI